MLVLAASLAGRVARCLAGHSMVDEAGEDGFVANTTTHALSRPGFRGGIHHEYVPPFTPQTPVPSKAPTHTQSVYTTLPPPSALPDFLMETSHANPNDLAHCPFQKALRTPLTKFAWQADKPALSAAFGR